MSEKYEQLQFEFVLSNREEPCAVCETPTSRVDLDFECRLCSNECVDRMWRDWSMHAAMDKADWDWNRRMYEDLAREED